MHTINEAKLWVAENREELISLLRAEKEAPDFMKAPGNRFEEVWCAGCWLNDELKKAGATKNQVSNISFAHGQRSLFGDTYKWAVAYLNEFKNKGKIEDEPGEKLANKINDVHMQFGDGFVAMTIEKNS